MSDSKITLEKIEYLYTCFAVYGYGNFDIYPKEVLKILELLESENYREKIKAYYEQLSKERMG